MASKKYKERYVTTIPFESEIYFEVERSLPRGVTISDELNAFLRDRYNELQKGREKKNLNAQAIGIQYRTSNETTSKHIMQTPDIKIDIYNMTIEEIRQQLETISSSHKLNELERKGKSIASISQRQKQKRLEDERVNQKLEALLQNQTQNKK